MKHLGILWLTLAISTIYSVISDFTGINYNKNNIITKIISCIIAIGLGGYQANTIQFGIDQLNDASTDEIKSFIIWYAMTHKWKYYS